jgi:hypothetical protein
MSNARFWPGPDPRRARQALGKHAPVCACPHTVACGRRRHRSCEAAAIASAPAASMTYIALILFSQASSSAIGGRQLMGGKVMKCNHRSFRNVNLVLRLVSHRRGRSNHVGFSPTQRRCIDVSRRFYF